MCMNASGTTLMAAFGEKVAIIRKPTISALIVQWHQRSRCHSAYWSTELTELPGVFEKTTLLPNPPCHTNIQRDFPKPRAQALHYLESESLLIVSYFDHGIV